MSEKKCLHKMWSEMSTPQLDETLQQELLKENPEEEVVLGILRVLEEREADRPVTTTREVSDAWVRYSERTAAPRKANRKRIWFVSAAAAAVICIVMMAIPQTVGAKSIFDVLFRWTESVFEFFAPEQDATNPPVEYVFRTDNPGLQQVYDKMAEYGVTEPVVPMWVPEGFELTEMKTKQMLDGVKISAVLQGEDGAIVLAYRVSADIIASRYEKEESAVEVYETLEVRHVIMDNGENILVTWTVDGVECSVNTDLEREEVYKLIDSIYRKELS